MKILVLGGTGAMGVHLVRALAEKNSEVYVTSRTRNGSAGNVHYLRGNAQNEEFLAELLKQKWDAIVDFMVYSTAIFQQRYEKLLQATEQYIFLSSSRVYADSPTPITEDSPRLLDVSKDSEYLNTDEYALSKARQEDLLFNSNQKNWTIIRPYITYDNERLQFGVLEKEDWLYRALHGRSIVTSSEIQSKVTTLTAGKDVAEAMCALVGSAKTYGEAFHITANTSLTWKVAGEIYQTALSKNGIDAKIIEQDLKQFLSWRQGKYQVIYDRLFNRQFDNKKINQFIDTSKFVAPEQGLVDCLEGFLKANPKRFKAINWREEALKDKQVGQWASLNEIDSIKQKIKYILFRTLPVAGEKY